MSDELDSRRKKAMQDHKQHGEEAAKQLRAEELRRAADKRQLVEWQTTFNTTCRPMINETTQAVSNQMAPDGYHFDHNPGVYTPGSLTQPIAYELKGIKGAGPTMVFRLDTGTIVAYTEGYKFKVAPAPVGELSPQWVEEALTEFFEHCLADTRASFKD